MKPYRVSQVNEYIAKKLKTDPTLQNIPVRGEISGFSKSGPHFYFSLKDADSIIKCAIWGSNARNIDMKLVQNGQEVIVLADISPYAKNGTYSLSVRFVESIGIGDLQAEFLRVKEMLEKEGLFDSVYKKPICEFPYRVGVVTSATGAAIEDIKKIITSKNNFTDILIFPTLVQGEGSVDSICENIELANKLAEQGLRIDTLIVGRGGGSPEDLASFNSEHVARTIFASKIPVISAVGHQSDVSISDFVADMRAETPTAAADIAVPDTEQLREFIDESRKQLIESSLLKIRSERMLLDSQTDLLYSNMKAKLTSVRSVVDKALITLKENDPRNIFSKGYAAVLDDNGNIVSGIIDIEQGNEYSVIMKDGSFKAMVTDIERSCDER